MEATILDLRYHMKKVLHALERNEEVKILYHGKLKGIIIPIVNTRSVKVQKHSMFGMCGKDKKSVAKQMEVLRGGRYVDI